jgi:hypothetical protein
MIRIRSKQHLFRRCGIAHPKDPVEYPDDRFTKKELAVLKAEPMLVVQDLLDEEQEPPPRPASKGRGKEAKE